MLVHSLHTLDLVPFTEPSTIKAVNGSIVQSPASYWTLPGSTAYQAGSSGTPEYIRTVRDATVQKILSPSFSVQNQIRETRLSIYGFRHDTDYFAIKCVDTGDTKGAVFNYSRTQLASGCFLEWEGSTTGERLALDASANHFPGTMDETPADMHFRLFPNEQDGSEWVFFCWGSIDHVLFASERLVGTAINGATDMQWQINLSALADVGDYHGFTQATVQHFR